jgi:hypothetical protein
VIKGETAIEWAAPSWSWMWSGDGV